MPCTGPSASEELGYAEEAYSQLKSKFNQVTRVACDLASVLRNGGTEADLSVESKAWIIQHDAADARRAEEEKTPAEKLAEEPKGFFDEPQKL